MKENSIRNMTFQTLLSRLILQKKIKNKIFFLICKTF